MFRKSQLIINHDSKILKSLGRSKRQSVNIDVNMVMNGLVGQGNQMLNFHKVHYSDKFCS